MAIEVAGLPEQMPVTWVHTHTCIDPNFHPNVCLFRWVSFGHFRISGKFQVNKLHFSAYCKWLCALLHMRMFCRKAWLWDPREALTAAAIGWMAWMSNPMGQGSRKKHLLHWQLPWRKGKVCPPLFSYVVDSTYLFSHHIVWSPCTNNYVLMRLYGHHMTLPRYLVIPHYSHVISCDLLWFILLCNPLLLESHYAVPYCLLCTSCDPLLSITE